MDILKEKCCITITFGEVAENHVGMQKVGELAMATLGFSFEDLKQAKDYFVKLDCECEIIHLNNNLPNPNEFKAEKAYILIVRNGINALVDADKLLEKHLHLKWDTKAKMRGRVVNKRARYNLCYSDANQEPDYENGKGTIIAFDNIPSLKKIRQKLPLVLGIKAKELFAEGNLYYDVENCGIGFHGDSERKKVIGLRLGRTIPLHYQWFYHTKPIGKRIKLMLNHGDLYIMSEKATGYDWKKRTIPTLRHAAGCNKYLKIISKKKKSECSTEKEMLMTKKVSELKIMLKRKSLKISGKKKELIDRLLENENQ